jgi:hypothetical protein
VRLSEVFTDAPLARDELRHDPQFAQAAILQQPLCREPVPAHRWRMAGDPGPSMACKYSGGRLRCQQTASNYTSCSLTWLVPASEVSTVYQRRHDEEAGSGVGTVPEAKSSHGRSHRFDPCHAHQHKRSPQPHLHPDCQQICQHVTVRFDLVEPNGQVIATSQAYTSLASAIKRHRVGEAQRPQC